MLGRKLQDHGGVGDLRNVLGRKLQGRGGGRKLHAVPFAHELCIGE